MTPLRGTWGPDLAVLRQIAADRDHALTTFPDGVTDVLAAWLVGGGLGCLLGWLPSGWSGQRARASWSAQP